MRSLRGRRLIMAVVATLLLAGSAAPSAARYTPSKRGHTPAIIRERHGSMVTSTNWSGYAITGSKGSVTEVKGSWIVPSVNCAATPTASSSFWVGIDGYTSNTVEQVGTDSDCQSGSPRYYTWFEFYPHLSFTLNDFPVRPNDLLSAEVQAGDKGAFTVSITNVATGQSFSTTTKMPSAGQTSAEWIIEAPYSGGVLPLADFVSVSFENCSYTAGNSGPQPIGPFTKPNVDELTMVTKDGTPKSQPSGLSNDKETNTSSFTDSWLSAGPDRRQLGRNK
jgi:hypothetical protein